MQSAVIPCEYALQPNQEMPSMTFDCLSIEKNLSIKVCIIRFMAIHCLPYHHH